MLNENIEISGHVSRPQKSTARSRVVGTLAQEILNHSSEGSFAIASEHQLCRRFNISRVTVRLALSELEAKGLIFRRHGKGTFAVGRRRRIRRTIGVLLRTPRTIQNRPVAEIIRGIESTMGSLHFNVLLIQAPPEEWSPEVIRDLSGVLVIPTAVTPENIHLLRYCKKPFLFSWETDLPGPSINFGQVEAARLATERLLLLGHEKIAFLTGLEESLDALKRQGIHKALAAVGKHPIDVIECSFRNEGCSEKLIVELMNVLHRPAAVISCDDHLAVQFIHSLRRKSKIRIPEDLSITSFHKSPLLPHLELDIATVEFDFFEAGRLAAEMLIHAALTGEPVNDIGLTPTFHPGRTIGRRSLSTVAR